MGPGSLTWPTVTNAQTNQTSNNDPLLMNNTGNVNISIGNVNITAFNLIGETNQTQFMNASNFTINTLNGGDPPVECQLTTATEVYTMANNTGVNITGAGLAKGNYTQNFGNITSGQQKLYFCLVQVMAGNSGTGGLLSPQTYSTAFSSPWSVVIG